MKKTFFLLVAVAIVALLFTGCEKDNPPTLPGETTEVYIDATSSTIWHYYSFAKNDTVGSAVGNAASDALWAARKDWDIAIRKYNIRTNSGTSTLVNAQGGVCAFNANTSFASILNVPTDSIFVPDTIVTYEGMGGSITTSQSKAAVTEMKKDENGQTIMPPVYLKTPVYIFRTADGNNYYKIDFTQYINENNVSGHIKFDMAQIYKD